jgi:hypothetical protein
MKRNNLLLRRICVILLLEYPKPPVTPTLVKRSISFFILGTGLTVQKIGF